MSNTLIQMDPPLAHQKAGEIRALKKNYDDTIAQLNQLVDSLDEFWKGAAQREYINQFKESQKSLVSMGEAIENYAKLLDDIAVNFKETDDGMAGQVAKRV